MSVWDKQWLRRQGLIMLALAVLFLLVFENSRLDLQITQLVFDAEQKVFPLQHHWLFEKVLHHGLKQASYVLGLSGIAFCIYAWRKPVAWFSRRQALLAGLGTLLIPLVTTILKHLTNRHCPWDVVDFGGYAPYVSLFDSTPGELDRGRCFPAGHASAGFVYLVWGLAWMETRPVWAKRALWFGVLLGLVAGADRLLQGAHFLSHVLWSAWFAWSFSLLLCALIQVPLGRPAPANSTTA